MINGQRQHLLRCHCGHFEHMALFQYWPDDDEEDRVVYVSVNLSDNGGFIQRIKLAIKYIFGWRSRYGHYTEIVLEPAQVSDLVNHLEGFLNPETTKEETSE